jgi:hypothetical protein
MFSEQYIRDNFLNISNEQDLLKDDDVTLRVLMKIETLSLQQTLLKLKA